MYIDDAGHPKVMDHRKSMDLILAFSFILNEGGT